MKQQFLLFAFLILVSVSGAFAQSIEQQVAKIRQITVESNKQIDAGRKDNTLGMHYAAWTVGGPLDGQQWSGVGTMHSTDEFYFDCEPIHMEECGAKDAGQMLRKIVSSYKGAADLRTRSEYFFDDKGELVFAFTSELEADKTTTERRFYFGGGKLIRITRGGKNIDAKFTAEDFDMATGEGENAKRLRNLFARMLTE